MNCLTFYTSPKFYCLSIQQTNQDSFITHHTNNKLTLKHVKLYIHLYNFPAVLSHILLTYIIYFYKLYNFNYTKISYVHYSIFLKLSYYSIFHSNIIQLHLTCHIFHFFTASPNFSTTILLCM